MWDCFWGCFTRSKSYRLGKRDLGSQKGPNGENGNAKEIARVMLFVVFLMRVGARDPTSRHVDASNDISYDLKSH